MRRSTLTSALALAFVAALPTAAAQAACPKEAVCEEVYFDSADGTQLHADVLKPKGAAPGTKHPVILAIGPYFGHGASAITDYDPNAEGPNERFKDLWTEGKIFQKGYAMVQVDSRGFGAAHGCNDFGGKGEQADSKAAVEWAASQEWSTGKVGMWGKSYDGWTQVMALDEQPKGLAATVIQAPIIDGYRTLYQNGVHYDSGWYGTPALYQGIDATPPSLNDNPDYFLNVAQGTDPACYAANIAQQNATIEGDTAYWEERALKNARGSSVPTLWAHGFLDANTKPDNFLPVYSTLKGPRRAWFGQFTHVRPQDKAPNGRDSITGRNGFIDEAMRWLDRYVAGKSAAEAPVENDPGVEVEDGATMKYRAEADWPPADAKVRVMQVETGSVQTDPTNQTSAERGILDGIWSVTAPLKHEVHLAGSPKFNFAGNALTPASVFALLYDVDTKGMAKLVTRGAMSISGQDVNSFELYPQDWSFKAGHRLAFVLATNDFDWYLPQTQGGSYSQSNGGLQLPLLTFKRESFLPSKPSVDELARPARFDVSEKLSATPVAFDLPPAMVTAPAAVLPGTQTKPGKRVLTVRITRRSGRLLASGAAPAGKKLTVRLLRGTKTIQRRVVKASRSGRFSVRFARVTRKGTYRAMVTTKDGKSTVRVKSKTLRQR